MFNSLTKLNINLTNEQKEQHGETSLQQYNSFKRKRSKNKTTDKNFLQMLTENPFHLKKRITFHTITQISIGMEAEQCRG